MPLSASESLALSRALAGHKFWLIFRFALLAMAVVAIALGLYLAGSVEFVGNPLTNYLVGLMISIGIGMFSFSISGWSNSRDKLLIDLLEEKSNKSS